MYIPAVMEARQPSSDKHLVLRIFFDSLVLHLWSVNKDYLEWFLKLNGTETVKVADA